MAQTRTLKRRVRSVKNAQQITKALEVVAASRMRRVVQVVAGSQAYGELASAIMRKVSQTPGVTDQPFFTMDEQKPPVYIIFTSDRGQAGALNSNIFRLALESFRNEKSAPKIIVIGRKGSRFFSRVAGIEMLGAYDNIDDVPDVNVFASMMGMVQEGLAQREFGKVIIIYTQFLSSLTQKATAFQLAPIAPEVEGAEKTNQVYELEPDIPDVLDDAIKLYLEAKLMQARIESAASEHAMRMVSMGNATRNASELIEDLTLELNATRQAAITQEIAEITGG